MEITVNNSVFGEVTFNIHEDADIFQVFEVIQYALLSSGYFISSIKNGAQQLADNIKEIEDIIKEDK